MPEGLKVGELARRSGLTIRTLHYWDEIGLLRPSRHTAAGHRIYLAGDIARLHQIRSLRFLGFALEEVALMLEQPEATFADLIRSHLGKLEAQIELAQKLKAKLETFSRRLEAAEELSIDDLIDNMEMMNMYEKYYSQEQLAQLEERRKGLGEEGMAAAQQEWPRLMAEVKALQEEGVPPQDKRAQALAQRWMELVQSFTGGDPGITQSLGKMYQQEPGAQQQHGLDPTLFAYVREAQAAAQGSKA